MEPGGILPCRPAGGRGVVSAVVHGSILRVLLCTVRDVVYATAEEASFVVRLVVAFFFCGF